MASTTLEAKSLKRFVQLAIDLALEDHTLYRGQREDWALQPKLARVRLRDAKTLTDLESALMADFRNQAFGLVEVTPATEWDWLALAQHHGLATRLLDWSTNALVALWFAVREPATQAAKPLQGPPGVVWVFNAKKADYADTEAAAGPYAQEAIRVFRPRHVTRRIVAQSGWFTAHPIDGRTFQLATLPGGTGRTRPLEKIQIPCGAFSAIRDELSHMGIGYASLFPDLDGLCQDILWNHTLLEDE